MMYVRSGVKLGGMSTVIKSKYEVRVTNEIYESKIFVDVETCCNASLHPQIFGSICASSGLTLHEKISDLLTDIIHLVHAKIRMYR